MLDPSRISGVRVRMLEPGRAERHYWLDL